MKIDADALRTRLRNFVATYPTARAAMVTVEAAGGPSMPTAYAFLNQKRPSDPGTLALLDRVLTELEAEAKAK